MQVREGTEGIKEERRNTRKQVASVGVRDRRKGMDGISKEKNNKGGKERGRKEGKEEERKALAKDERDREEGKHE